MNSFPLSNPSSTFSSSSQNHSVGGGGDGGGGGCGGGVGGSCGGGGVSGGNGGVGGIVMDESGAEMPRDLFECGVDCFRDVDIDQVVGMEFSLGEYGL